MSEQILPPNQYESYLQFPSPQAEPWTQELVHYYLTDLGASNTAAGRADIVGATDCYDQQPNNRAYHGPDHRRFVGQPYLPQPLMPAPDVALYDPSERRLSNRETADWAMAATAVAGTFHDAAYKHVDAIDGQGTRAWPTVLANRIGSFARYERSVENGRPVYRTYLTEAGREDAVTQMVAQIFGVGEDGIVHNQGGNEFDSALAAAKFLEEHGTPAKPIIAVTAEIAATVPFKTAVQRDEHGQATGDGHMGELAHRVKSVQLDGYQPDWQDVNDIMLLSVNMANRDIAPFIQPGSFGAVIHNGRGVKREEKALLGVVDTMPALVENARRESSAPLLYEWLATGTGFVPAANVPHVYIPRDENGQMVGAEAAYPPLPYYEEAVGHAETNSRMASTFFKAHEAGIALAASIATLVGEPGARVPGFVHAKLWNADVETILPGNFYDSLTTEELRIYYELAQGTSQQDIDTATPARSPIGGMLFGALRTGGIEALSAYIASLHARTAEAGSKDAFSDRQTALEFVNHVVSQIGETHGDRQVGVDVVQTIVNELRWVAEHFIDDQERGGGAERIARLGNLALSL